MCRYFGSNFCTIPECTLFAFGVAKVISDRSPGETSSWSLDGISRENFYSVCINFERMCKTGSCRKYVKLFNYWFKS